jgi:hypothetical protein
MYSDAIKFVFVPPPQPPTVTNQPSGLVANQGTNATFTVGATGLDDGADAAGEAATMDDGDFMAALSRAFQESERQRDAEGEANDDEGGAAGE